MSHERVKIFRGVGHGCTEALEREINDWLGSDKHIGYEVQRTQTSIAATGDPMNSDMIVVISVWYVDKGGADTRRARAHVADM